MTIVNRDKIMESILDGLELAQSNYSKWTNNRRGISSGAEYVLTTYVAQEINKIYSDSIYVEEKIDFLMKENNELQVTSEVLENCRSTGKTDIALYKNINTEEEKVIAIIELKNSVDRINKGIESDILRIMTLIDIGVIEYGIFAFNTEIENEKKFNIEKTEEKMKKLVMTCKDIAPDLRYKYKFKVSSTEKTNYETYWSWGNGVIIFS